MGLVGNCTANKLAAVIHFEFENTSVCPSLHSRLLQNVYSSFSLDDMLVALTTHVATSRCVLLLKLSESD